MQEAYLAPASGAQANGGAVQGYACRFEELQLNILHGDPVISRLEATSAIYQYGMLLKFDLNKPSDIIQATIDNGFFIADGNSLRFTEKSKRRLGILEK